MSRSVDTAVILAAGMGTRLSSEVGDRPKGLLDLGNGPIIGESIGKLVQAGIEQIVVVTGHGAELYEEFLRTLSIPIVTVQNPLYATSGSMYSLYCARAYLEGDFLLLESDLVYENRALTEALSHPGDNCVLLSDWTGAGDEVFVSVADDRLVAMSKDPSSLVPQPMGELVGITRISVDLFRHMLAFAEEAFQRDLLVDYETDCLAAVASHYAVECRLVKGLLWAEIDDPQHLLRAQEVVYPAIRSREAVHGDGEGREARGTGG